jgi:DnaJ-class molecular chaperone
MAQQPEFQDYYKTLGVPRTASQAEIKKAFRKLARESHPDKHAGDKVAERRFKEINEANAVLSDPAKRSKYDQFGRDWEAYARAGAAAGGPTS